MADFILGKDAKLYVGDADAVLGSQVEMSNVTDVNVTLEAAETDVTTRGNGGWSATGTTLKSGTIDFEMIWKPSDTCFAKIRDAYLNGVSVALTALTGDKSVADSEGPRGNWAVTSFSRSEPLAEAIKASVTLKMSKFAEWVEI